MCYEEVEDWYECKRKKKARAFTNYITTELRKNKIYSLPVYDQKTDTFKDGPLPIDADGYFSQPKDERTYYS